MRTILSTFFVSGRPLLKSCTVLSHVGCLGILASLSLASAQADDLQTIRDAWRKRHDAIKSFHFECELEETRMIWVAGSDGLFDEPKDKEAGKEPIVLLSDLTFNMSKGKFAYVKEGETWDGPTSERIKNDWQTCFDGVQCTCFLKGRYCDSVNIEIGVDLRNSFCGTSIGTGPLRLWYSPSRFLSDIPDLLHGAKISGQDITVRGVDNQGEGRKCIELTIPFKGSDFVYSLYVDPTRDYLPLKYISRKNGLTIRRETTVDYVPHDRVGWVASKWKQSYFEDSGELESSYVCNVRNATVNEPIDEKLFRLEIPVGTRIAEKKDGHTKYYIQEANEKRRQVSEEEFGKIPEKSELFHRSPAAPVRSL